MVVRFFEQLGYVAGWTSEPAVRWPAVGNGLPCWRSAAGGPEGTAVWWGEWWSAWRAWWICGLVCAGPRGPEAAQVSRGNWVGLAAAGDRAVSSTPGAAGTKPRGLRLWGRGSGGARTAVVLQRWGGSARAEWACCWCFREGCRSGDRSRRRGGGGSLRAAGGLGGVRLGCLKRAGGVRLRLWGLVLRPVAGHPRDWGGAVPPARGRWARATLVGSPLFAGAGELSRPPATLPPARRETVTGPPAECGGELLCWCSGWVSRVSLWPWR